MKYDPNIHHRRSIRLKEYDYSQAGAYFLTLCTYQRQCLFGEIVGGAMQLNPYGQVVAEEWVRSPTLRREIELDQWVIMPNHFHGIVLIQSVDKGDRLDDFENIGVGAQGLAPLQTGIAYRQPKSLSTFVAGFKSAVTKRINRLRDAPGNPLWQRNYYEHVIRDEPSCHILRQYIANNPLSWELDQLHPKNPSRW